jgi:pilus assembly protein CpaB
MRRLSPWVWLVLSIVFGTVATFMALGWLRGQSEKQVKKAEPMASVVVAAKDIGAAIAIGEDLLVVHQWPEANRPPGSFASAAEVAGRVAAYPFAPGEPILEVKLAPKGAVPGLTALLPSDKRAITIKVDEASGVAGFLSPDNRVDVLLGISKGKYSEDPAVKTVLQNIKVLGIGQKIEKVKGDKPQVVPTVTLEVTPEECEKLALAAQEGRISLILRGQKDDQPSHALGTSLSKVMGKGDAAGSVELIKKNRRETANF